MSYETPIMKRGMGQFNAYLNGYLHGVQDKVTKGWCTLEDHSEEYYAWMQGYQDGESDAIHQTKKPFWNHPIRGQNSRLVYPLRQ